MCDLNIVVPMAGAGSRFAKSGYERPKPLIDIHGKHMIELVINKFKEGKGRGGKDRREKNTGKK